MGTIYGHRDSEGRISVNEADFKRLSEPCEVIEITESGLLASRREEIMSAEITVMFDRNGKYTGHGGCELDCVAIELGAYLADDVMLDCLEERKRDGYTFRTIDIEKTLEELGVLRELEEAARWVEAEDMASCGCGGMAECSGCKSGEALQNVLLRLDKLRAAKDDEGVGSNG